MGFPHTAVVFGAVIFLTQSQEVVVNLEWLVAPNLSVGFGGSEGCCF